MDYKHIENLLEKYWACETSIVEEKELKAFFSSNQVPEHLKETAALFKYYDAESNQKKLGTDFDNEVLEGIGNDYASKETKEAKVVQWFNNYAKVAAVILIVITLSFVVTRTLNREQEKIEVAQSDTYEDPEDAFEETKKALLLISTKIGKGKKEMEKLGEFNKAQEKIKNEVEL